MQTGAQVETDFGGGGFFKGSPQDLAEIMRLQKMAKAGEQAMTPSGNTADIELPEYLDREKFAKTVVERLGEDPRIYDVEGATKTLYEKRLPKLWNHVFQGRVPYGTRVSAEQQNFFADQAARLYAFTQQQVQAHQLRLKEQYDFSMGEFEKTAATKKAVLGKKEEMTKQGIDLAKSFTRKSREDFARTGDPTVLVKEKEISAGQKAQVMLKVAKDMDLWEPPGLKQNEAGQYVDAEGKVMTPEAVQELWDQEFDRRVKAFTGDAGEAPETETKKKKMPSLARITKDGMEYSIDEEGKITRTPQKKEIQVGAADRTAIMDSVQKIRQAYPKKEADSIENAIRSQIKAGNLERAKAMLKRFLENTPTKEEKKPGEEKTPAEKEQAKFSLSDLAKGGPAKFTVAKSMTPSGATSFKKRQQLKKEFGAREGGGRAGNEKANLAALAKDTRQLGDLRLLGGPAKFTVAKSMTPSGAVSFKKRQQLKKEFGARQ